MGINLWMLLWRYGTMNNNEVGVNFLNHGRINERV